MSVLAADRIIPYHGSIITIVTNGGVAPEWTSAQVVSNNSPDISMTVRWYTASGIATVALSSIHFANIEDVLSFNVVGLPRPANSYIGRRGLITQATDGETSWLIDGTVVINQDGLFLAGEQGGPWGLFDYTTTPILYQYPFTTQLLN